MKSRAVVAIATLSVVVSFTVGYLVGSKSERTILLQEIHDSVDFMALMYAGDYTVSSVIELFEEYREDPVAAEELAKRMILIGYSDPKRLPMPSAYIVNKEIEEFIRKHPLAECKGLGDEAALKCSLSNIWPKE